MLQNSSVDKFQKAFKRPYGPFGTFADEKKKKNPSQQRDTMEKGKRKCPKGGMEYERIWTLSTVAAMREIKVASKYQYENREGGAGRKDSRSSRENCMASSSPQAVSLVPAQALAFHTSATARKLARRLFAS